MFAVPDMRATVAWYQPTGFTVWRTVRGSAELAFARLAFGNCEFTSARRNPGPRDVSLWFFTDRVEDLYLLFKHAGLASPHAPRLTAPLASSRSGSAKTSIPPFYGGRQFSIRGPTDSH